MAVHGEKEAHSMLKMVKIAVGSAAAILLADLLGLNYSTSAGIITLLTIQDTSRETANELMHLDAFVDVLIPRGGAGLIRAVAKEAGVPVIRTGEGVCHIYVDSEADLDMGAEILYNAKCSRPSVCNAAECVLVHEDVLEPFLQKAVPLLDRNHVELRCDGRALAVLGDRGVPAEESDCGLDSVHLAYEACET